MTHSMPPSNEQLIEQLKAEAQERIVAWDARIDANSSSAGAVAGARTARRMSLAVLAVVLLVSSLLAFYTYGVSRSAVETAGRVAQVSTDQEALRQTAEDARLLGQQANEELQDLGQPQVQQAPDDGTPADAIVSATTAQVVAALARNTDPPFIGVTSGEVAQQVAQALVSTAVRPDPVLVAQQVATYLSAIPTPQDGQDGAQGDSCDPAVIAACVGPQGEPGPQGNQGQAGPPPTSAEIVAAFREAAAQDPQLLCPTGGTYQRVEIVLADATTRPAWLCVGDTSSPTTTTPAPTTEAPAPAVEPTTEAAPASSTPVTMVPLLPLPPFGT